MKNFLNSTGLKYLWGKILELTGLIDEVKADKPQLDGVAVSIEEYVEDYVSNNASGGTGTFPSQLDIYCGNSIDVMD